MSECQITMHAEPMFPGQAQSPVVGRGKCSTHRYSFEGPVSGKCPIGELEQRLDQMEIAMQAIALGQPTCLKDGRLSTVTENQR